ncbi:MAG: rhodanese-like domain-containing protein [Actinobacteria bacterium]|nr:rhodanese-like domain-containing protein [Actinomycetota bacterium]
MPEAVDRDRLIELLARGAQLVEVLSAREYEHLHLPGAINLPIKELSRDRAMADLAIDAPVVTYCNGFL